MTTDIQPVIQVNLPARDHAYDTFLDALEVNLRVSLSSLSDKNRGEYLATFKAWTTFAESHDTSKFDFDLGIVESFLKDNEWSFNTRKTRLAHLRKFAEILAMSDKHENYNYAYNFGRFQLLKPKALGGKKRITKTRSLSHKEVYKVFDVWTGDSNKDHRNQAILGLMILSGLRASEVVAARWENVNYSKKRFLVTDGKGGKSAHAPMLGDLIYLLQSWQTQQRLSGQYEYVCSHIFRSDKLANDKECTTRIISSVIAETSEKVGFRFNPHDTRRTAITLMLDNGASVAQARDFARHESGETTLIYAKKTQATRLGVELDGIIKFGDVLGAKKHTEEGRYWECSFGHQFKAHEPLKCPICGITELSHQISMFDD